MKLLISIIMIAMLTGCASSPKFKPGAGSVGDAATTYYALEHSGMSEMNPLLDFSSTPVVVVASIGIKHLAKYSIYNWLDDEHMIEQGMTEEQIEFTKREFADTFAETAGMTATGWNIAGILGANPITALPVAIGAGWLYWNHRNNRYKEAMKERGYE